LYLRVEKDAGDEFLGKPDRVFVDGIQAIGILLHHKSVCILARHPEASFPHG
jgi:hypothetical protein